MIDRIAAEEVSRQGRIVAAGTARLALLDKLIAQEKPSRLADPAVEIVKRYQRGEPTTKIAKKLRMNSRTVLRILERLHVVTRKQVARQIMDTRAPEIILAYRDGKSLIEVGKEFGISECGVRIVLAEHGVPKREPGPRKRTQCKICRKPKVKGRLLCREHEVLLKREARRNHMRRLRSTPPEKWRIAA